MHMEMLAATSSSRLIFFLVVGLVVGFVAYRSSETYKRQHQVTPWHIPSLVWGLIGFLSLLLCAVLFLIARRTTKPADAPSGAPQSPPPGWYPDPTATHELRYWDGAAWTDRVENGGVQETAGS
jgi:F0F1-type ATP synthase assembly protein I